MLFDFDTEYWQVGDLDLLYMDRKILREHTEREKVDLGYY